MNDNPQLHRRRAGVVNAVVTALTTLALLGVGMSSAVAQPARSAPALASAAINAVATSAKKTATRKPQAKKSKIKKSKVKKLKSKKPTPKPTTQKPTTQKLTRIAAIGSARLAVKGTNVERAANALIVYQAPVTVTRTNMWGVEVTVVNGKVSAVNDREPTRSSAGTTVPASGYLLSGHGTAAEWLRVHAKIGATVSGAAPSPNTTTPVPTTPAVTAPTPAGTAPMALPAKVTALYHMMWSNSGSPQLRNTPAQVNVVNLSFLRGSGVPRLPGWASQSQASFVADAKLLRARGVRIVASVGGEGSDVNLANREAFVQGVMNLNAQIPLDGLDWDIEGAAMGSSDVVWISKRLKTLRGNSFAITMAPNGNNIDQYRSIAVELHKQNALDLIGQQFYDAVVSKEAAKWRVGQLVDAGIPQSKISIGMMVGSAAQYWTVDECLVATRFIKASYPGIRGGYLWEAGRAGTAEWAARLTPVFTG